VKYTILDLQRDFPTEEACLDWLIGFRWPEGIICKVCQKVTKHYKETGRKSYCCAECGNHLHPMAGTIFHRSRTPLVLWMYAIYRLGEGKAGVSAAQLQREIGVTYKTAWRMLHQIRKQMGASDEPLSGEVEIDETFIHPNPYKRTTAGKKYGYDARRTGSVIFGIVQRGGEVKLWHVKSTGARVLQPLIQANVQLGSVIHTDGYLAYRILSKKGYDHRWTDHGKGQFYTPDSYTQNIENVWSHLKRGIKGVYRHVSDTYLQLYAQEFAFRYSYRNHPSIFWVLAERVSRPVLES
jgi:transposase